MNLEIAKSLRFMSKQELKDLNNDFTFFWSGTFSQWKNSRFVEDGKTFTSAEQYMMYHKAILFNDSLIAEQILAVSNPKEIKALGRKVRNFNESVWNENKYEIVKNGNILKFSQNPRLKEELLSTRDSILVEASPFDSVWGIKLGEFDPNRFDPLKWRGENLLGFALTEVREIFKKERVQLLFDSLTKES